MLEINERPRRDLRRLIDIIGQRAAIKVASSGGKTEVIEGKITYVQLEIQSGGDYAVWVDVDNRKTADGKYVLLPGMEAAVTIDVAPATVGRRE